MIKRVIIKYLKYRHEYIKHQLLSLEVKMEYLDNPRLSNEEAKDILYQYEYWKNIDLSFTEVIKFLEAK